MYIKERNVLIDRNTSDFLYIIDLESGIKVEYQLIEGKIFSWLDHVTLKDIDRAKERDKLDISSIINKQQNEEEEKLIKDRLINFLKKYYKI